MTPLPALIAIVAMVTAATSLPQGTDALLRRSDVGAFVPEAFRARLSLSRRSDQTSEVELWRSGRDRTLVRFLDPKERGKYLLRRGADLWLLTPGAKKPVRLSPSHRVYGAATIDVLFGLRLSTDYRVESVHDAASPDGSTTVFELRALSNAAQFSAVRYAVNPAIGRPVNARYSLPSGRHATLVEFDEWSADRRYARVVTVSDLLRGDTPTRIEIRDFEERAVPDALFDLEDASARQALDRSSR